MAKVIEKERLGNIEECFQEQKISQRASDHCGLNGWPTDRNSDSLEVILSQAHVHDCNLMNR